MILNGQMGSQGEKSTFEMCTACNYLTSSILLLYGHTHYLWRRPNSLNLLFSLEFVVIAVVQFEKGFLFYLCF
jgi:hypothetical protein